MGLLSVRGRQGHVEQGAVRAPVDLYSSYVAESLLHHLGQALLCTVYSPKRVSTTCSAAVEEEVTKGIKPFEKADMHKLTRCHEKPRHKTETTFTAVDN